MSKEVDLSDGYFGTIIENAGGGDCFYYAVAEQIDGVDMDQLRGMIADDINVHRMGTKYITPVKDTKLSVFRGARDETFRDTDAMISSIRGNCPSRQKWANSIVIANVSTFLQGKYDRRLIIYKHYMYYDFNPMISPTVLRNGVTDLRRNDIVIIHSATGGRGMLDHYEAMYVRKRVDTDQEKEKQRLALYARFGPPLRRRGIQKKRGGAKERFALMLT